MSKDLFLDGKYYGKYFFFVIGVISILITPITTDPKTLIGLIDKCSQRGISIIFQIIFILCLPGWGGIKAQQIIINKTVGFLIKIDFSFFAWHLYRYSNESQDRKLKISKNWELQYLYSTQ